MDPLNNHPLRFELSNEVHARPPEALYAPSNVSFLAMTAGASLREAEHRHLPIWPNASAGRRPPEL